MRRITIFFVSFILLLLVGCVNEKSSESAIMKVNNNSFKYDATLIEVIDKTKWIDTSKPPTVKTMTPLREPQYIIEVMGDKKEKYKLWDEVGVYLLFIQKGDETYWLALEGEEYEKAKNETEKYKNLEVEFLLDISDVVGEIQDNYKYTYSYPIEKNSPFYIPGIEQEKNCFNTEKECIRFYKGTEKFDADTIKTKLEGTLALVDMVSIPRIYVIKNVVLMYVPEKPNDYVLEEYIKSATDALSN